MSDDSDSVDRTLAILNSMDEHEFEYGDLVQHKLQPEVRGIVIGDADFGRIYHIRLAGSLGTAVFHGVELLLVDMDGNEPDADEINVGEQINFTDRNVIPFEKRKAAGSA